MEFAVALYKTSNMELLKNLEQDVTAIIQTVETTFVALPDAALNHKESPTAWSVLECFEHLNRYSVYYNDALALAISKHRGENASPIKYTWFGGKSIKMVDPNNTKPMTTIKRMNPAKSQLNRAVLDTFLAHQKTMIELLSKAEKSNLNKKAIKVEFMKLIKLRIGESLEFIVRHEQRHIAQALRALQHQSKQDVSTLEPVQSS
jgi:hypothetical protein